MVDDDTKIDPVPAAVRFARVDPDETNSFVEVVVVDDGEVDVDVDAEVDELTETRPLRVSGTEVGYRAPPLPLARSMTEDLDDTETVTDVDERRIDTDEIETLLLEID